VTAGAPPKLTACLPLAERIHLALVSLSDGAEVFTGCDSSGKPLRGHGHAYVLCESNPVLGRGGQGEITHVTIFARMDFGTREQEALQGLRDVWGPGEIRVSLLLQGLGRPEDFGGLDLEGPKPSAGREQNLGLTHTLHSHAPPQGHAGGGAQAGRAGLADRKPGA